MNIKELTRASTVAIFTQELDSMSDDQLKDCCKTLFKAYMNQTDIIKQLLAEKLGINDP